MPSKAHITYSVHIEDIYFCKLSVMLNKPSIELLEIETKENKETYISCVVVIEPFSQEEACNLAKQTINDFLDVIAFSYGTKISALKWVNGELEEYQADGTSIKTHIGILGEGIGISAIFRVSNLDQSLVKLLNSTENSNKTLFYKQFRFALQSEDHITRYMFCYNILLSLKHDKQKNVENFIKKELPNVPKSKRENQRNVNDEETVYTRLRNEIAHIRSNTSFEETSKEIKARVNELEALVYKAIDNIID